MRALWKPTVAIVGLGITEMGKIYGRGAADFAAEAVALALDDAGLYKSDLDGLLVNGNGNVEMEPRLQMTLGLEANPSPPTTSTQVLAAGGARTACGDVVAADAGRYRRRGPRRLRGGNTSAGRGVRSR
jgi:acetyl-CoA acetyltransferase